MSHFKFTSYALLTAALLTASPVLHAAEDDEDPDFLEAIRRSQVSFQEEKVFKEVKATTKPTAPRAAAYDPFPPDAGAHDPFFGEPRPHIEPAAQLHQGLPRGAAEAAALEQREVPLGRPNMGRAQIERPKIDPQGTGRRRRDRAIDEETLMWSLFGDKDTPPPSSSATVIAAYTPPLPPFKPAAAEKEVKEAPKLAAANFDQRGRVEEKEIREVKVAKEVPILASRIKLPAFTVGFPGQEKDLKELAGFTVRGACATLRGALEGALDNEFGFLNPQGCGLHGKPQFANNFLDRTVDGIIEDFRRYCGDKKFNFAVTAPLLETFLQKHFMQKALLTQFSESYNRIRQTILGSQKMTGIIDDITENHNYAREDELQREVETLKLKELFGQLAAKAQEIIAQVIPSLRTIDLETLLRETPAIDLNNFLTENKGNPQAAALVEGPALVKKQRPPLSATLPALQEKLTQEMADRVNQFRDDPEETVMAYGNSLAKQYHGRLNDAIAELWGKLDLGVLRNPINNSQQILQLYSNPAIERLLEHKPAQTAAVKNALKISLDAEIERARGTPCFYLNANNTLSQYEYLMRVSSRVSDFYTTFKDSDKGSADLVITTFFNALADQDGKCQAGLVGRMFMAEMQIMTALMDYYARTTK